jgi:thiamine pyrophosphate-dependent acetolactate synthase large subunit-like protein
LNGRVVATNFDPTIDIIAIAKASGAEGIRVKSPKDLATALQKAKRLNAKGVPCVVEVAVDQAHHHAEFDRFHGYKPAADSSTV